MNNFHSDPPLYYRRWLTPLLQAACEAHPVVVLTGARQVGKSTLLRRAEPFNGWRYHTMDDFDALRQVRENPASLWAGAHEVVLDEVQKAPELLPAIKRAVDEHPGRYRFLLSGSANLLLMGNVSESLAGRAVYLVLDPLTLGELHGQPPPALLVDVLAGHWPEEGTLPEALPDPLPLLQRGFMPALLALAGPEDYLRWWEGYVATYLERDLRQMSQVESLVDFRRVMALLALRTGQLLNQSEVARDAGLSQPTIHRYLNLLEATHLFERVPTYLGSHTTRLLKSPRVFWSDVGLAVFLAGYYSTGELSHARELGAFFETLIYQHLRVSCSLLTPRGRLHFWRTQTGDEVDFVIEHGRRVVGIEVKMTDAPGYRHAAGLVKFLGEHPQAVGGILLHGGQQIRRLDEKIVAVPWSLLTG
ncbi:MAG TPA: ATP-binding protein [Anaerolineae bacterium]|nr:ATP-binding protein [Anaerolineae bacterium]